MRLRLTVMHPTFEQKTSEYTFENSEKPDKYKYN